jgi:tRNA threonylcarbamoyladenosine biosynthesis protein TsaE
MNTSLRLTTANPEETHELGRALGAIANPGDVFLLTGTLGVGKTCLTQGIAAGLGITEQPRSPTFVLVTEHMGRLPLYHMDLYRLDNVTEVMDLGLDEYLFGDGVSVVEWADKAPEVFPLDHLAVHLEEVSETHRGITINVMGPNAFASLQRITDSLEHFHDVGH